MQSSLKSFFLFNRTLGVHEEDSSLQDRAGSLLYFFPVATELDQKVQEMELIFSFLDISRLFSTQKMDRLHSIVVGNSHYAVLEVEPDIFCCISILHAPASTTTIATANSSSLTSWVRRLVVGGSEEIPPGPSSSGVATPPPAMESLRAILSCAYDFIYFLSGQLCTKPAGLESPFGQYLARVVPLCALNECNMDTLHCAPLRTLCGLRGGVEHVVVDRHTFLAVQGFMHVNPDQMFDPLTTFKMLLFGNQLVWNSIDTSALALPVYAFFTKFFRVSSKNTSEDGYLPIGKYTFGEIPGAKEGSDMVCPRVYLLTGTAYRVCALRVKRTVLILLLADSAGDEVELAVSLQRFKQRALGEVHKTNALLEEMQQRILLGEDSVVQQHAFVYGNQSNLVFKQSPRFREWTKQSFPLHSMRAFAHCHARLSQGQESCLVVLGEWCVTAWRSGSRWIFRFSACSQRDPPFANFQATLADMERLLAGKFGAVIMS